MGIIALQGVRKKNWSGSKRPIERLGQGPQRCVGLEVFRGKGRPAPKQKKREKTHAAMLPRECSQGKRVNKPFGLN